MKILSVEKYKGNTYEIVLENNEHIYINEDILFEYGFKADSECDCKKLSEAMEADLRRKAKERALYLLTYRDHSYSELFDKLKGTYGEEIAYDICDKMCEYGFVNDRKYASRLAKSMWEQKCFGIKKIRYELSRKGFTKEMAEEVLSEYYELDAKEGIEKLIDKKYAKYLGDLKGRQKVINALARLGHSYSDIKEVIQKYTEDE